MKRPICLVVFAACGPVMNGEPSLDVERDFALSTPKHVEDGRAETEPEAPPFAERDGACARAQERKVASCEHDPESKDCQASLFETFWDPLARECRLMPEHGYSGAGCMSGGGGGLSIARPPESVGLRCFWGAGWSGCACECEQGDWDAAERRCE